MTEMLVTIAILGVLSGAVFSQMDQVQQRAGTEQVKVDDFQEARDFVDQFFRDINQVGYPNSRMADTASGLWVPPLAAPLYNDSRLAMGLVRIDNNELRFEGDTNGNGTVESIVYMINGSGTCALCLQRSQVDKVTGDPIAAQTQSWGTEVNDVVSAAIYGYYDTNGNLIAAASLPADVSTATGRTILASVKTIKISLTIRNNAVLDTKTNQAIETNFEGEVSINNCSMAASAQPMSCN
ncbi:MAG TPA: type II secretion system protein [Candidatus Acidoferrum sp.]|nr:type II secretion system protein [Candidatus Acidoferrum sp.]